MFYIFIKDPSILKGLKKKKALRVAEVESNGPHTFPFGLQLFVSVLVVFWLACQEGAQIFEVMAKLENYKWPAADILWAK